MVDLRPFGGNMRGFAIFIVIVIVAIVLFFIGLSRVPDMLAGNLSKKFGVPVSIDSMHFGFDEIEVENMEIGNPKGYSLPKAFSAEEIEISTPITHFLKDDIEIDEVEVDNIYLGIEFDSKSSTQGNWTTIFANFKQRTALDEKTGKKIFIKKLTFRNIRTELLFRNNGGVQKLPLIREITLKNISTEGGVPTDQLTGSILGQMIKEVFIQQNMENLLQGIIQSPGKAVDTFLKPFEGFFNAAEREDLEDTA